MVKLDEKGKKARERICLALDVPSVDDALGLVDRLFPYVGTFKVGKQLHTQAGMEARNIVQEILAHGGNTFLDLKFKDTSNTVYEAARASAVPGVYMFNLHVGGGEAMCKKAVEGAQDGTSAWVPHEEMRDRPKVIGVTVLTSLSDSDLKVQGLGIGYDDLVRRRTELAREWGLDGVVCPANKAGALEKEFGKDLLYVTPGIKYAGKQGAGQKQLYTPDLAVRDCSNSILVVGSAITKADNQEAVAYEILQAMAKEL